MLGSHFDLRRLDHFVFPEDLSGLALLIALFVVFIGTLVVQPEAGLLFELLITPSHDMFVSFVLLIESPDP